MKGLVGSQGRRAVASGTIPSSARNALSLRFGS